MPQRVDTIPENESIDDLFFTCLCDVASCCAKAVPLVVVFVSVLKLDDFDVILERGLKDAIIDDEEDTSTGLLEEEV